jgi:hypothetical protein
VSTSSSSPAGERYRALQPPTSWPPLGACVAIAGRDEAKLELVSG